MLDDCPGGAPELVPGLEPAPAELAVFGRPKRLVEAAEPPQGFGRKGEVVGREEALAAVQIAVVARDQIDARPGAASA